MRVTIPIDLSTWSFIPLPCFFNSRRAPPLLSCLFVRILSEESLCSTCDTEKRRREIREVRWCRKAQHEPLARDLYRVEFSSPWSVKSHPWQPTHVLYVCVLYCWMCMYASMLHFIFFWFIYSSCLHTTLFICWLYISDLYRFDYFIHVTYIILYCVHVRKSTSTPSRDHVSRTLSVMYCMWQCTAPVYPSTGIDIVGCCMKKGSRDTHTTVYIHTSSAPGSLPCMDVRQSHTHTHTHNTYTHSDR